MAESGVTVDIGERLRKLRVAKGLSQRDIQGRSGLHRSYISRAEAGRSVPTLRTLERWAEALEIELYEAFFEGKGRPQPLPLKVTEDEPTDPLEEKLFQSLKQMTDADRKLFLSLLWDIASRHNPGSRT